MEEQVLARLRARFVERLRGDLARIETELGRPSDCNQEAQEEMARIAHGLSGAGGSFGFAEISRRAAALETALEEGGADAEWRALADELRRATT